MTLNALQRHDGNRKAVVQGLGFYKSTFFSEVKAFGIDLSARDRRVVHS